LIKVKLTRSELRHIGLLIQLSLLSGSEWRGRELLFRALGHRLIHYGGRHGRWHVKRGLHSRMPALNRIIEAPSTVIGILMTQDA
jgi:hypothetical protein